MDYFIVFNLIEGLFWITCAGLLLFLIRKFSEISKGYKIFITTDFILFGISDFIEAYHPYSLFDVTKSWLFAWKVACVVGFVAGMLWYMKLRSNRQK